MNSKIFISYARKDYDAVVRLRDEIFRRTGVRPWMDVSGIETGTQFADVIAKAIDGCELLIFVMSSNSVESPWTQKEVMYALNHKKKIYPVVIDDVRLPRKLDLLFADVDRVDVRDCVQREKLFSDLNISCGEFAVETIDGRSPSAAVSSLVTCPVCGKKNDPTETFICRGCKRENLCLRHQDEKTYLCHDCATKAGADDGVGEKNEGVIVTDEAIRLFAKVAAAANRSRGNRLSQAQYNLIKGWCPSIYSNESWRRPFDETEGIVELAFRAAESYGNDQVQLTKLFSVLCDFAACDGSGDSEVDFELMLISDVFKIDARIPAMDGLPATDGPSTKDSTGVGTVTGAAVGSAIGSIIPGVGTILGAGIGAGIGAGVGWLKKHKSNNSLKEGECDMSDSNSPYDVFISYSRKDADAVGAIKDEIERTLGLKCWMDLEGIESGSREFTQDIIDAIDVSTAFLFFLSRNSQESEWALNEIDYAKSERKHVVLVRFNADPMTKKFRFAFGRTDIIDWRDSLQKEKLVRDLKNWASQRPVGEPCGSGAECSVEQSKAYHEETERKAQKRVNRRRRATSQLCHSLGECKNIMLPGGVKMKMIWCPPGEFLMGSPESEKGRFDNETQHRVMLTKGFWLGKYPVMQRQWKSVMENNPAHFKDEDLPVESVSWDDCQKFIEKVNSVLGCDTRLPTEAEWEYACRAGTTGAYGGAYKLDDMGWYGGNSHIGEPEIIKILGIIPCAVMERRQTHPVGQKKPNDWGFCDMHGNVWEWCNDWCDNYSSGVMHDPMGPSFGNSRVLRGGSYLDDASQCRSARHHGNSPGARSSNIGFRLCCSGIP